MERGVVRMNYMQTTSIKTYAIISCLILFGAGCVGTANHVSPSSENPLEKRPVTASGIEKSFCDENIVTTVYERPRLLPNAYRNLEALGPLFTLAACDESQLRLALDQPEGEMTIDRVIILKTKENTPELRDQLIEVGFMCDDDMTVQGCHTKQAGTRVNDLLTLQPYADAFVGDYFEDAMTSYDQDFTFTYPVDATSSLCTSAPTENESMGGYAYPVSDRYSVYDKSLGAFFTQYQCSRTRRIEALGENGLYDRGVRVTLKHAPSDELLKTLQQIGFVCIDDGQSDEACASWALEGAVPNERLIHLEPFTEEIDGSDCVDCG